jgi:hypothetical protein
VRLVSPPVQAWLGVACTLPSPRGVAASASIIAVSHWTSFRGRGHGVALYDAVSREFVHEVHADAHPARLNRPYGLRLTRDGAHVVVADFGYR